MAIRIFIVLFLGLSNQAFTITPQKYCESLAATSCELLNVDISSGSVASDGGSSITNLPTANIKYCRDRVFKTISYGLDLGGNSSQTVRTASDISNKRRIIINNGTSGSNVVLTESLDNNLCSETFLLDGFTALKLLP